MLAQIYLLTVVPLLVEQSQRLAFEELLGLFGDILARV